jgi:DNA repair protein RadA/Sms
MARAQTRFVCQECGEVHAKWQGQCTGCGAWNSMVEDVAPAATPYSTKQTVRGAGRTIPLSALDHNGAPPNRILSGVAEFDRSLGGGLVPASAILLGGDPGIGKSTLLLQAAARLALAGQRVIYLSGEEAADQVRLRAQRLGLAQAPVALGSATSLRDILATLEASITPACVVIDSIQTLYADQLDSAPGTVSQVRLCAQELIRYAKGSGAAVVLVGHVTKDGQIAGPRVLEHMVDTVLYFEGERGHPFRILRAVKNRFGGTDEIGVFEMGDKGLQEVANPSALFLSTRDQAVPGAVVFAGMEGVRPMLLEIQALVARVASGASPRRAVVGWDSGRLAMVLAVLEARCALPFSAHEVYLNVAGGLRISEPAADLAVAAALVSALMNKALPFETVVFGEIALSGEIRPVSQSTARLREAGKLGFSQAFLPARTTGLANQSTQRMVELKTLGDLVDLLTHANLA